MVFAVQKQAVGISISSSAHDFLEKIRTWCIGLEGSSKATSTVIPLNEGLAPITVGSTVLELLLEEDPTVCGMGEL